MGKAAIHRCVWAMPVFVIAVVGLFAALYLTDPGLYLRVLTLWGFKPFRHPFVDAETLLSQVRCSYENVDVYVTNACAALGVPFDYSPLWLRMPFVARAQPYFVSIGLAGTVLFALALAVLPPARSWRQTAVTALAIVSPVTLFALERANADLLMFALASAAVALWGRRSAVRAAGDVAMLSAALLKFYPIVLLASVLLDRPRPAMVRVAMVGCVVTLFVVLFGPELARALAAVPHPEPFTDGFGAMQLPSGLAMITDHAAISTWLGVCLYVGGLAAAIAMAGTPAFDAACRSLTARELHCLLASALILTACFFGGVNIGYRGVFLVLALPGLTTVAGNFGTGSLMRASPLAGLLAMWNLVPLALCGPHSPFPAAAGPIPFFTVWVGREIAWWWTILALASVLLWALTHSATLHAARLRLAQLSPAAGGVLGT